MNKPRNQERRALQLAGKGLLRARDARKRGVPTVVLTRLVAAGRLERIGRGVYAIPDADISAHRTLAEAVIRVPRGVICLLSALRMHEIGLQMPSQVWLALPHKLKPPRLEYPQLRIVRMSGPALTSGIERRIVDGVPVPVFSAAKTVVDCFKYRNKIGTDVAVEALREGWRARKFKLADIWRYARICRVANVMRPYLEAL